MELFKFSKFKLQLRALITEVRELRGREESATEQLNLSIQKQKQAEEEFGRKITELQAELALSNELRLKLERKVSYLQHENASLENKEKELKGTINSLLQSRENFVKVYEDSTCEMKRSIHTRDRKLAIFCEKINAHLLLFDSIEKEAFSVKQVLDNVQHLVSEKEGIVIGLKSKMDKLSAYENVFIEKISDLENRLRNDEDELQKRAKIISELEAQLEGAKMNNNCQPQIQELQETLSAKDMVIQNLLSEKKALQLELWSLGTIVEKIQGAVTNMNDEDRKAFSSVLGVQEECAAIKETEINSRIEDACKDIGENSPCKACYGGTAENTALWSQEHDSENNTLHGNNYLDSCTSEFTCSSPQPANSEPQSANALTISVTEAKDKGTTLVCHQDSESSTTQAETSKDPG